MRNILEYPVTYEEKLALLRELRAEYIESVSKLSRGKILFGDIRSVILQQMIEDYEKLLQTQADADTH